MKKFNIIVITLIIALCFCFSATGCAHAGGQSDGGEDAHGGTFGLGQPNPFSEYFSGKFYLILLQIPKRRWVYITSRSSRHAE